MRDLRAYFKLLSDAFSLQRKPSDAKCIDFMRVDRLDVSTAHEKVLLILIIFSFTCDIPDMGY